VTLRGLPWWFLLGLGVEVVGAVIAVVITVIVFFAFGEIRYKDLAVGLAVIIGIPALVATMTASLGGLLVRRRQPALGGVVAFWPVAVVPLYYLGFIA